MSLFVLDTDILTLFRRNHPQVTQRVLSHPLPDLAITVLTIEEQVAGCFHFIRQAKQPQRVTRGYQELADTIPFLARFRILTVTAAALTRSDQLQTMKLQVRKTDRRIAAIVLEHGGILVTRDLRDFQRVPSLVIQDWSV